MKIILIGLPGAGKSYYADILSKKAGIQKIDIDYLLDNPLYFYFKKHYAVAFDKLLEGKDDWIIDGYHRERIPDYIWAEADRVILIDLPKSDLRNNVYKRYKTKKQNKDKTHSQSKFTNLMRNLSQI